MEFSVTGNGESPQLSDKSFHPFSPALPHTGGLEHLRHGTAAGNLGNLLQLHHPDSTVSTPSKGSAISCTFCIYGVILAGGDILQGVLSCMPPPALCKTHELQGLSPEGNCTMARRISVTYTHHFVLIPSTFCGPHVLHHFFCGFAPVLGQSCSGTMTLLLFDFKIAFKIQSSTSCSPWHPMGASELPPWGSFPAQRGLAEGLVYLLPSPH